MSDKKLLVAGELNIDMIFNDIQGFPEKGKEILASQMDFTLGSSSAIMAANCASLGINTSFCGCLGKDNFGAFILTELQNKHINTQNINSLEGVKTGITMIMNYDQDRANVTYCGAMDEFTMNDIPWEDLHEYNHFHLSNFFIQKGIFNDITEIFKKVKEKGLTTSLDLQWDPSEEWNFDYKECLPYVDIFMPNEAEIKALTGCSSIEEAIETLRPYVNWLALKMGEKGSMGISGGSTCEIPAFTTNHFIDAIGAGDSFNSGFILKYLEGGTFEECLRTGNLTGALNTTAAGGTAAFADKEEIRKKVKTYFNEEI